MTLPETASSPGVLPDEARAAAVHAALPLLAGYFADAPTWSLEVRTELGATGDPLADELAGLLRLRIALAAARQLAPCLVPVLERPSHHWSRTPQESVGAVRGRLDTARYARERTRPAVPPTRYPITVVERRYATPENQLAAYAVDWVSAELAAAPLALLPAQAPERREAVEQRSALERLLQDPVLRQALGPAREVHRRGGLARLVKEVDDRMATRRVAQPERYRPLVAWVRSFDALDAATDPGLLPWAIYDERFDTKLFELWALATLLRALESRLGPPLQPAPGRLRSGAPAATWSVGGGRVTVRFQGPLGGGAVRWRNAADDKPLGGTPDITVEISDAGGKVSRLLMDPKLRVRPKGAAEEIYKMLGYFHNSGDGSRWGALLTYAPGGDTSQNWTSDDGGRLLVRGVDPLRAEAAARALEDVAELALELAGVEPAAPACGRGGT